jgi:hypothetical protein
MEQGIGRMIVVRTKGFGLGFGRIFFPLLCIALKKLHKISHSHPLGDMGQDGPKNKHIYRQ